jgi:hypothetical protein
MSINIERSPFSCVGRFFQFLSPPKLLCHCLPGNGFDSGKQWQSNLGGDENWKNRTTYKNGEHSMLIDFIEGGCAHRVLHSFPARGPKELFVYLNTGDGFDNGKQWQSANRRH